MNDLIESARHHLTWLPDWGMTLFVFAAAYLFGLLAHRVLFRFLTRVVAGKDLFWRSTVARTRRPSRLAVLAGCLVFAVIVAPVPARAEELVLHILVICLIVIVTWFARIVLHIWRTIYLRRFKLDAEDNLLARKHVTQSRILLRVADILIYTVGLAAVLMTFESIRQYGISLLASAGAAGLVVGLALQPVLKNLIAGIQLAITQPIRIDDALLVEGEWGQVEEITSTYVVVRLWDWRRLIVPLAYFIDNPFQNWTRESASLIGTVLIYLDYTAPVATIRGKAEEIARASSLWDGQVINVAVTDFRQGEMELRILVSARNAARTFDLRCEMREKLIDWLQREIPDALPRTRAEIGTDEGRSKPQAGPLRRMREGVGRL
ncbi:mechanosensitive ion channel family protein [Rubellimicrobium roseum]|uniref:Mechanosensitive ion channel n=1 Tax=Rubellimicrobium roseum TaxID=687525 RepID=A0A5C4NCL4_9RHOB|nr:mechanosensitive ion channel domain-containing protein [Rubellimicrobium roseum]TNC68783.1 mechanosensitive ion channel [Rubellimicrobium roseum]